MVKTKSYLLESVTHAFIEMVLFKITNCGVDSGAEPWLCSRSTSQHLQFTYVPPWRPGARLGPGAKDSPLKLRAGLRSGVQRAGLTPLLPYGPLVTLGKSLTSAPRKPVLSLSVHSQCPARLPGQERPQALWVNDEGINACASPSLNSG